MTDASSWLISHLIGLKKIKKIKKERKCKIPKSELDIFRYLFWPIIHLMASN